MKQKAFTLTELLVVMGVILLLLAIILPNYRAGERQFALQRSAHKLAQDLRRAQEMAMATKEFRGWTPRGGYGIFFKIEDPKNYILFAEISDPPNFQYDGESEKVETISLEKGVEIKELSPDSSLNIVFLPPDPTTVIQPAAFSAKITLSLKDDPAKTKSVLVNKAGLIEIE